MQGGSGGGNANHKHQSSYSSSKNMKNMKNNNNASSIWSIFGYNQPQYNSKGDIVKLSSSMTKIVLILFPSSILLVYLFYFYPLNLFASQNSSSSFSEPFESVVHLSTNLTSREDIITSDNNIKTTTTITPNVTDSDAISNINSNKNSNKKPSVSENSGSNAVGDSYPTVITTSIPHQPTTLDHLVFGIAASANLWEQRKEYIKIWWRPGRMRGYVWLDKPVKEFNSTQRDRRLPALRISADTSRFPYKHPKGSRSAIRISRIVSETFRLRLQNVHWFVMGDDDTVFLPDNLLSVLSKFDHRQPYYIGSLSESHLQNIYFSYSMAYGGGGFAISYPLAEMLVKVQDRCIYRYPALYGSDDRIQACMAELGVPLTKHQGFHQYDVYGDLLGLLAAHPVVPFLSLHHLDVVKPIFPDARDRADAVSRLFNGPVRLDSAAVMQQSICYDDRRKWTVSVSWGFVVMVVRGTSSPREMEMPARTFLNWYPRADYTAYPFNTRPLARSPCQKPYVYYLVDGRYDGRHRTTVTRYRRHREQHPPCNWRTPVPSKLVEEVVVYKKPDPGLWDRAPRRNCCRVIPASPRSKEKKLAIEVGVCRDGEVTEAH